MMMKLLTWFSLCIVIIVYAFIVDLFGFEGPIAMSIHFFRIAITVSAMIMYARMLPVIFSELPPPRRDYLIAGINFMLISAVCFSFWNEAGRIFKVDTSVFTNATAGLFSLFLCVGAGFALVAPYTIGEGKLFRIISIILGIIASVALVFIAPLFR